MTLVSSPERVFTTKEFEHWWESQGKAIAHQTQFDPTAAKFLAWEAWRKGREHMSHATASHRLHLARR